jgi:hypothetical protein
VNLFTSYFAVARKVEAAGLVPVSIALWPPRGWRGRRYPALAPKREMFGAEDYEEQFEGLLAGLDTRAVVADLERLGGGGDVALLCFEKPGPDWFCHRRLVAEWVERETGLVVPEWGWGD